MKSLIDDVSNSIGLFIFCNCRRYYNFTVGIIATAAHSCFKASFAKTKRKKLGISKRMGYARQKQAYNTRNVFLDNNFISISLMFSVNCHLLSIDNVNSSFCLFIPTGRATINSCSFLWFTKVLFIQIFQRNVMLLLMYGYSVDVDFFYLAGMLLGLFVVVDTHEEDVTSVVGNL